MDYKISMIIPVYNVEKFLHKSFDSLKRQTIGFENLQIIFADDCSTDKSWEIIREFSGSYTNVESVRLPQNSGAAGAPRNAAMELAKAKYFICFDPDDELPDDACKLLYDAIEQMDVDFAFGYHSEVDSDGAVLCEKPASYNGFDEKEYKFPDDIELMLKVPLNSTVIRKTALFNEKKMSYPVGIPLQDFVVHLHYLLESKCAVYIGKHILIYTIHPNSMSFSHSKKYFLGVNQAVKCCYELFEKYEKMKHFDEFARSILSHYFTNKMFVSMLTDGDIQEIYKVCAWLWNYCAVADEYGSNCAVIMGAVFSSDRRLAVYKSLREIVLYELELVNGNTWLSKEIEHRDIQIRDMGKLLSKYSVRVALKLFGR